MSSDPLETDVGEAWAAHRAHLLDLAFRMLGDIGDAEDVVQEAFARFASSREPIQDAGGWLIVVTSRLCLDRIRSARSRRELTHDFTGGEPQGRAMATTEPDPADRVTLDDTVRLALLVLMQQLSAAERVVFVLHDVFQMPFEEVAEAVGRPVGTCRQIARRARHRLEQQMGAGHRFDVGGQQHREVTQRFIAACASGDLSALLGVLNRDASGEVDLGVSVRAPGVAHGAYAVAANVMSRWHSATLVSLPVTGAASTILAFREHVLAGVIVLTVPPGADEVSKVHVIADPAKLAFVRAQLEFER